MTNDQLENIETLGEWIATHCESKADNTRAKMIRDIVRLVTRGQPGDKVYFHGDPLKYEDAKDHLYALVSQPRGLQDLVPQHIEPSLWFEKLLELRNVLTSI